MLKERKISERLQEITNTIMISIDFGYDHQVVVDIMIIWQRDKIPLLAYYLVTRLVVCWKTVK
jgi:hypothetical protein